MSVASRIATVPLTGTDVRFSSAMNEKVVAVAPVMVVRPSRLPPSPVMVMVLPVRKLCDGPLESAVTVAVFPVIE